MNGQIFLCYFRAYSTGFQKTLFRVDVGSQDTAILKSKDLDTSSAEVLSYIVDTITANTAKPIVTFNTATGDLLDSLLTVLLTGVDQNYTRKNSIKISLVDKDFGNGVVPGIKVTSVHQNVRSVAYYQVEEPTD